MNKVFGSPTMALRTRFNLGKRTSGPNSAFVCWNIRAVRHLCKITFETFLVVIKWIKRAPT